MRRNEFMLPYNAIYMCGHSLGPMPQSAKHMIEQTSEDWGAHAVTAWNIADWINLPYNVAARIAPLIGASASEVVVSDSTSINLYKVLISALTIASGRQTILTTDDNFPADLYIAQGVAAFKSGIEIKTVKTDELMEYFDKTVAVLMLTHVNYRDASMYDMERITDSAHKFGILVIWDLSHSIGAVPVNLKDCGADFAVGCTYKYLNGGPGAPAFIYVNECHHHRVLSPIYGWMGHERPFAFDSNYKASGVAKYLGGTPYIMSLKALEGALRVFDNIDLRDLYAHSVEYSSYLINSLEQLGLKIISPRNMPRGGHVAFIHNNGYALSRALIDHGVICDYREPGLIRLCVNPLYLSINDIKLCVNQIQKVLEKRIDLLSNYQQKLKVT